MHWPLPFDPNGKYSQVGRVKTNLAQASLGLFTVEEITWVFVVVAAGNHLYSFPLYANYNGVDLPSSFLFRVKVHSIHFSTYFDRAGIACKEFRRFFHR
jgi:hypothetical protein